MAWRFICRKCGRQGPARVNPNDADNMGESHQDAYGVAHRYNVVEDSDTRAYNIAVLHGEGDHSRCQSDCPERGN